MYRNLQCNEVRLYNIIMNTATMVASTTPLKFTLTLENPRAQLVKIDHVILVYFTNLCDRGVINYNLCLLFETHGLKMAISLINSNHWICESNDFYWAFYSSETCYLSGYTGKWFGGVFGARPEIFPPFKQVWSLSFLWSSMWHFRSVSLCSVFENEIQPLPDLLSTEFTIIEIGLYYGGEPLGVGGKNMQINDFLHKIISLMVTCRNPPSTVWVLLMFY